MISSKPSQYIKGWVEFYKLRFKVTPDVLIPRPETELLVDEVLIILRSEPRSYHKNINKTITILDLGTGSGNIAISLACNLRGCNVNIIATDISPKALRVAKQNAKLHGVEDKIKFIQSDLLSTLPDIIVTNLPYIPSARIPYLDSSVKDFEPHLALDGGEDGFKLYRKLFQQLSTLGGPARSADGSLNDSQGKAGLHPRLIIGEIDYTHGELAVNEAQKYFPDAEIEVKKDLAYLQRIIFVRLASADSEAIHP